MYISLLHFHIELDDPSWNVLTAVSPCVLIITDANSVEAVAGSGEFCFVCF